MRTLKPEMKADTEISLGARSSLAETDTADILLKLRIQLSSVLQTTLELDTLIKLFAQQVDKLFGIDGVELIVDSNLCAGGGYTTQHGHTAIHHCEYSLNTDDQQLAQLRLYSRQRIAEAQLALIEIATSCLVYPLKNAIQYRNTLLQAHKDPLTGLGNRLAMQMALEKDLARTRRHKAPLSVLMIDIDHFKSINDTYGHTIGDHVIAAVAQTLEHTIRDADNAFRYGGEEFLVILDDSDLDGALCAAERIRHNIDTMTLPAIGKSGRSVTVSVGCATLHEADSIDSFIERADQALYKAKAEGRNRSCTEA